MKTIYVPRRYEPDEHQRQMDRDLIAASLMGPKVHEDDNLITRMQFIRELREQATEKTEEGA